MKYTNNVLHKIENIFEELEYSIVYGKGNFQSSYCLVEKENKVVVNDFFGLRGKIEILVEILLSLDIDHNKLSPSTKQTLRLIYQHYKSIEKDES